MEDWLAAYKDSCRYDLGESGMPDISVGELLERCGESIESLSSIVLKDNDTRGTERLRAAICAAYAGDVPFDHITVTTGTSEALFILFNLLLESKTVAVVPFPSFQALYEVPKTIAAEIRYYHVAPENGYRPDPDEICSLIDDSVGVVVINSPHNPSGVLVSDDSVEAVAAKARAHGAYVIADEHYRFLPHNGPSPIRTFARFGESVVATGSLTKCFGLIGLRVGWIAAAPALIGRIRDFRDYLTHTLSPLSDHCAALALEHFETFAESAITTLNRNCSSLRQIAIRTPGISLVTPEAGVVAFPGFAYPISSEDFSRGLIERYGVFVLPGSSFEVDGHIRINLGMDPSQFNEALGLLSDYCATLRLPYS